MQELDLALEMLHAVLDEKTAFAEALRLRFQGDLAVRPYRQAVAGIVGCELRHHLLYRHVLKGKFDSEQKERLVALALSNHLFFHRFDEEAVNEAVEAALTPEEIESYRALLSVQNGVEGLLGDQLNRSSNLYLSLRFNTPEWVLKIFQHFGYGVTYKTIRTYSRPRQNVVRVRGPMPPVLQDGMFAPNAFYPGELADYLGKTSLRKRADYREGRIYDLKPIAHKLLVDHKVEAPCQILLYDGNPNSGLERDLIDIYGASIGLNIAVPSVEDRPEVTRLIRDQALKNVNFFSAPNGEGLQSAVSTKQDLVICAPNSTNFDDIPTSPDYLLRFDKETMDGILKGEKEALEACSAFVEDGGTLLYVVFTISKKEGERTLQEFLVDHPEFVVSSAKQHFPFEKESCHAGLYVAELKKGKEPLTIAPSPAGMREGDAHPASAQMKGE